MRLFIATPLSSDVERYLGELIEQLRPHGAGVKWVKSKNIHLTLRFLGETDQAMVPKITKLIDLVASDFPVVTSKLGRVGGFPNLRRPRVIWVGLEGGVETLSKMADQIELGLRELHFEPEKKGFKAHLTLGRVRDHRQLGDLAEKLQSPEPKKVPVAPAAPVISAAPVVMLDKIVLFKSTLTPQGPVYDRLHESPLGQERFGD
ncbi:MAG: RNA 2',3'-cyclic phosphodiesterase [bacterium]